MANVVLGFVLYLYLMNKAQNVTIDTGNINLASSNYTDAYRVLQKLSVSIHEFSLTKTVCPEGEGHYDRTK
jgi:hypothetical protein